MVQRPEIPRLKGLFIVGSCSPKTSENMFLLGGIHQTRLIMDRNLLYESAFKMLPSTRCLETQKRWLTVICLFHVFTVPCQVLFFFSFISSLKCFSILSFSLTLNSFQCKDQYETAQVSLQGLEEEAHTDEDRRLLNKCILWSRLCLFNEIDTDSESWISFFFSLPTNATQKDKVTEVFSSWIGCTVYHVTKVF